MARNDKLTRKAEVLPATSNDDVRHVLPRVDVYENADEILLVADMPGVSKEGIDIRLEDNKLTISGRQAQHKDEPMAQEYDAKVFERTFTVPRTVDGAKITAEMARGELKLHLPKSPSSRTRQIQVQAG